MRVLDRTGRASGSVLSVAWSLGCEMLTGLQRATWPEGRGTYEEASAFDDYRTRAPERLVSALEELGGGAPCWGSLCGLALADPPLTDVPALIERVERTPARELRLIAIGSHASSLRHRLAPLIEDAADGDQRAIDRVLEADPYPDGDSAALRHLLSLGLERAKALTVEVLGRWYDEFFAAGQAELRGILERDAAAKLALSRDLPMEQLIERATNGLQYTPLPGIRRIVLTPHVAMRPWNKLNEWDDAYLIMYPVADESLRPNRGDPPPRLGRLYRALDDDRRLRILKLLAGGEASLQEIAEHIGIAKSTAHHHMVILRAAGLVSTGTGFASGYSLRPEMVRATASWLESFLQEDGGEAGG